MKLTMTFNPAAMASSGYQKADIYRTIKSAFVKRGLRCTSESDVLSFEDSGGEHDYAYLWNVTLSLLKSKWFVTCASSCVFYDDDGTEEDVLSQAWKIQRRAS
jgi:hypothetical protein